MGRRLRRDQPAAQGRQRSCRKTCDGGGIARRGGVRRVLDFVSRAILKRQGRDGRRDPHFRVTGTSETTSIHGMSLPWKMRVVVCLVSMTAVLRAALQASRSADRQRSFFGTWMFCFWAGQSVQMLSGDLLTYWRVLPVYFFVLALAVRQ